VRDDLAARLWRSRADAIRMKRFLSEKILTACELAVASLLTAFLVAFHAIFFLRAGALWRDEVSSLALATKPTAAEFWRSLPFDPFPAAYFILLRLWHGVGLGENDLALRGLGLLIGVLLIGAVWLSCSLINKSAPLWPLTLFALNPLTLEGGDSLRPYGFGLIWITLAFAFIWRIAFDRFGKAIALFAFVAALLSVQSLFTNAFILFAIGVGAAALLLQRKSWLALGLIFGIGLIAAISLLPYLPIIHVTGDWAKIIATKNDIAGVVAVGDDAISYGGTVARLAWLAFGAGLLGALLLAVTHRLAAVLDLNRDQIIFAATTMAVAGLATIGFLCTAQYLVFPRYFLPAMAIAALCVHNFWNSLPNRPGIRIISLFLVLLTAATALRPFCERAKMRMTNCDQIAVTLEQRAGRDDLIILTSFLYGVSFQRYYHGQTPWLAVPQIEDFSLHRWDLLKQAMARPDPVPDLISRAEMVLRAGHKIFLVGKLGPPSPTQPEPLPPAPESEFGWQMEPYLAQWKSELTYWFEHHALHGSNLPIEERQRVNPFESLGLFEVSGWREP
jgi:hypothetical protein